MAGVTDAVTAASERRVTGRAAGFTVRAASRDALSTAARASAAGSSLSDSAGGGAVSSLRTGRGLTGPGPRPRAGPVAGGRTPIDGTAGIVVTAGRGLRGAGAGKPSTPPCLIHKSRARSETTTSRSSATSAGSSEAGPRPCATTDEVAEFPSVGLPVGEGGCAMGRDTNANSQFATYVRTTARSDRATLWRKQWRSPS